MEKKRIFEKVMLCLNKGKTALTSGSIWRTSNRNEMKKVFIFENYIKETKVFCTNDEVGGTLGLILGRFFLLTYL